MAYNSVDRLSTFILLLNICCINRSFWFEKRNLKLLGHLIFIISLTVTIASIVVDVNNTNDEDRKDGSAVILQGIVLSEVFLLSVGAVRFRNCHKTMKTLDDKCHIPGTYKFDSDNTIDNRTFKLTILRVTAITFDTIALKLLNFSISTTITLSVGFAAHDTEIIFCSLLINELNKQLSKLPNVDVVTGTKIYRHVLIGSSRFNEDYNLIVAIMIFVTFMISVIFGVIIILSNEHTDPYFIAYIFWRELRYLYTLWILCVASYNTKKHCLNLVRHLTAKLVFDLDGKEKTATYKLTKRWLVCTKSFQPSYSDVKKYSIDLKLPLIILNITFNNLLVIAQIHKAIKRN